MFSLQPYNVANKKHALVEIWLVNCYWSISIDQFLLDIAHNSLQISTDGLRKIIASRLMSHDILFMHKLLQTNYM